MFTHERLDDYRSYSLTDFDEILDEVRTRRHPALQTPLGSVAC